MRGRTAFPVWRARETPPMVQRIVTGRELQHTLPPKLGHETGADEAIGDRVISGGDQVVQVAAG
jgi:hypothetical protein